MVYLLLPPTDCNHHTQECTWQWVTYNAFSQCLNLYAKCELFHLRSLPSLGLTMNFKFSHTPCFHITSTAANVILQPYSSWSWLLIMSLWPHLIIWISVNTQNCWLQNLVVIWVIITDRIASFTKRQKGLGNNVTWQLDISGFQLMSTMTVVGERWCDKDRKQMEKTK